MEVFIGIGSNLGDRLNNIYEAIKYLKAAPDIDVKRVSSVIETDPCGEPVQPKYLNCVIKIETTLAAFDLLNILQNIENELGRKRLIKNGPRTIDLDILLYGSQVFNEPNLKIPHPRMWQRAFVIKPLLEILNAAR